MSPDTEKPEIFGTAPMRVYRYTYETEVHSEPKVEVVLDAQLLTNCRTGATFVEASAECAKLGRSRPWISVFVMGWNEGAEDSAQVNAYLDIDDARHLHKALGGAISEWESRHED